MSPLTSQVRTQLDPSSSVDNRLIIRLDTITIKKILLDPSKWYPVDYGRTHKTSQVSIILR